MLMDVGFTIRDKNDANDASNQRFTGKMSTEGVESSMLLIQKAKAENSKEVIIFWDSGSSISLVKKDYALKQRLNGVDVSYELVTLGNVGKVQNTKLYDVPLIDFTGRKHIISAYAIDEICRGCGDVDITSVVKLFSNLKLKDVQRPRKDVDILVGMDYAHLQPESMARCENLVLYKSLFGTRRILGGYHEAIRIDNKINMFVKTVAHARSIKIEVLKPRTGVDFFTAETFGVNVPPKCRRCRSCKECTFDVNQISRCEQYELEVIKKNLKLDCVKSKWTTTYPYKVDPVILKENRYQADTFLKRTEKRISKSVVVKEQYCKQFQNLIDRGVFREIPEDKMRNYDGPTFYITHHEIYKEESSSTPVRIVSNTSLKNKDGMSLNDIMMKGLTL